MLSSSHCFCNIPQDFLKFIFNWRITALQNCVGLCHAKSLQLGLTLRPHRWQPTRLPRPWDSPGKNTGVGCHFLLQCMKVKSESEVTQSCPTLSNPMDCSLPDSSVHGIVQARVLEWGAIAFSDDTDQCMAFILLVSNLCLLTQPKIEIM